MYGLIIGLFAVLLVALFSVQNATPVVIAFFFWKFEASLAVVIFLSALTGALAAVIVYSSLRVKKAVASRRQQDESATKYQIKDDRL
ncbi:MAG TPA: LapA family protein [Dissulfurispiraceae bacterium]|nr:LapA family protein [Dissulfurispiraceae bacterium]